MGGRLMLKAAAMLIALGYCSLLAYQSVVTFNVQESRPVTVQESELSIATVTKTVIESEQNKNITLDDIFISVKTSKYFKNTRLPLILKTWFQLAKNQTWFFTDVDNAKLQLRTHGHIINTNCSASHQRKHLCCKTSVEYDYFLESGKRWFCHFDDDNYVNVPRLVAELQKYNPLKDWYLGKNSIKNKLVVYDKSSSVRYKRDVTSSFWFATGGAGYCISRSLALKMSPIASGGKFISICEKIRFPDDVSMGFVIENIMNTTLTVVPEFHSHLEQMKLLNPDTFRDQISFSYLLSNDSNVIKVPGFDERYDPTRFMSLHCFLFPHFNNCPR